MTSFSTAPPSGHTPMTLPVVLDVPENGNECETYLSGDFACILAGVSPMANANAGRRSRAMASASAAPMKRFMGLPFRRGAPLVGCYLRILSVRAASARTSRRSASDRAKK
jgi:hypothetical protein